MKVFILVAVLSVVVADDHPTYRTGTNRVSSRFPSRPSTSYGAPNVNTAAFSRPQPARQAPSYGSPHRGYDSAPQPYQFDYSVNDPYSGTVFSRNEESDGKTTRGYYSVDLPDGRTQHVTYTADGYTGYNADVSYTGKARHPAGNGGGYSNGSPVYNGNRGRQQAHSSYESYGDDDNLYRRH